MNMNDTRHTQHSADIVEVKLPEIRSLCRRYDVRRLYLFGSAATGRFDPARSDLDFMVEFVDSAPPGLRGAYFSLLRELEDLFDRRIDLVTDAALQNPYRRRRIDAEKKTLYSAP